MYINLDASSHLRLAQAGVEAGVGSGGRWQEERQETDGERQARVTERHPRDGHER